MKSKRVTFRSLREGQVFWFYKSNMVKPIYRWRKIGANIAEDPDKLCEDCLVTPAQWVWVWVKRKA